MKRPLALIAAIASMFGMAFAAAPSVYQTGVLILSSLAGTEYISLDNGGPRSTVATVNTVRNTQGYLLSSATSGTVSTWTSSASNLLLTGNVGTLTADLPASPPDGMDAAVCNAYGTNYSGTITVATTDSSTIVGSASLSNLGASTCAQYQYTAASAVWYKLR